MTTKPFEIEQSYADRVVTRQEVEAVYLTNAMLDPAHGSPEVFERLGLTYERNIEPYNHDTWGHHYPLTKGEDGLLGYDLIDGPYGGVVMGYSALYRRRKWLMPTVEVCFYEAGTFSRESYGGTGFETRAEAERAAHDLAERLVPAVCGAGGHVLVAFDGPDRFAVQMLFPFSYAAQYGDYGGWAKRVPRIVFEVYR